jgi:hypothetical protein
MSCESTYSLSVSVNQILCLVNHVSVILVSCNHLGLFVAFLVDFVCRLGYSVFYLGHFVCHLLFFVVLVTNLFVVSRYLI